MSWRYLPLVFALPMQFAFAGYFDGSMDSAHAVGRPQPSLSQPSAASSFPSAVGFYDGFAPDIAHSVGAAPAAKTAPQRPPNMYAVAEWALAVKNNDAQKLQKMESQESRLTMYSRFPLNNSAGREAILSQNKQIAVGSGHLVFLEADAQTNRSPGQITLYFGAPVSQNAMDVIARDSLKKMIIQKSEPRLVAIFDAIETSVTEFRRKEGYSPITEPTLSIEDQISNREFFEVGAFAVTRVNIRNEISADALGRFLNLVKKNAETCSAFLSDWSR